MFLKDILPDIGEASGQCLSAAVLRRLEDAVDLLTTEGLVDAQTGEVSVCVCGNFVTLPMEAEVPLAMTVNGVATIIRDSWFTLHVNGPGDTGYTPCRYADVLGMDFCTFRDPDRPVLLGLKLFSTADAGKKFRVFGLAADGTRIHSPNASAQMEDGFYLPTVANRILSPQGIAPIVSIERIAKDEFNDMCELYAFDPTTGECLSKLGIYRPRETEPHYTRVRTTARQAVRVRFKRRNLPLRDQYDWIACDSREAVIHAVRAVKSRLDGNYDKGDTAEATAVRLAKAKTRSRKPGGIAPPQILHNGLPEDSAGSSLYYG